MRSKKCDFLDEHGLYWQSLVGSIFAMQVPQPEKLVYTPAEFAAVFGKSQTWGYRQLYAGKVKAITEYGRTLIPKSEVERVLQEAGIYEGAKKAKKEPLPKKPAADAVAPAKAEKPGKLRADAWRAAIIRRRKPSSQTPGNARSADGRKPS